MKWKHLSAVLLQAIAGYFGDGSNAYTDNNVNNTPFTIPPVNQRSIGDVMIAAGVSWAYYGDQWNAYLNDKYQLNFGTVGGNSDQYCNICNPFQYQESIMAHPEVRKAHLKDTTDLYEAIQKGTLPAVSFVKPSGWVDGHPASSKWNLFEGFVKKIVDEVQANPSLWATTAIFITADEGGGYYDSGYVQSLDYFGDGTRIPLIVVSPFTKAGHISHTYNDHVSITKFIEYNWGLPTITKRSRDNLPNPMQDPDNPPGQSLCANEQSRDRRFNGPVRLQRPISQPSTRNCLRCALRRAGGSVFWMTPGSVYVCGTWQVGYYARRLGKYGARCFPLLVGAYADARYSRPADESIDTGVWHARRRVSREFDGPRSV